LSAPISSVALAVKTNSPSDSLAGIESDLPVPGPSTVPEPVIQKIQVERPTTQDAPTLLADSGIDEIGMSIKKNLMLDEDQRYVRS